MTFHSIDFEFEMNLTHSMDGGNIVFQAENTHTIVLKKKKPIECSGVQNIYRAIHFFP